MDFSIIHYYGVNTSKCGYCKGRECSIAHGMHAYKMLPQDYQDLIDRGWRRSGHYCYKPDNKVTCCPCYTIKCDALDFKLSKSHKKILKRVTRFLRDGKKDKSEEDNAKKSNADIEEDNPNDAADDRGAGIRDEPQAPDVPIQEIDLDAIVTSNTKRQAINRENAATHKSASSADMQVEDKISITSSESSAAWKQSTEGLKPPCKKAKQMRLERKQAKLAAKGIDPASVLQSKANNSQEKTLNDYIATASPTDKHKLKIVLVPSNTQNFTEEAFNLYCKYQLIIHNDNPQRLTPASLQRFCYKSPLKLKLVHVKSRDFRNSLKDTYTLYQKYQTSIHSDPPTNVKEYLDFLQRSPLLQPTRTSDGPPSGYGSFHQQYWLDDKLIAVAVLDILPYCVSSVYFFYDPDYKFLSLGTYGSLREIHFVQELAATVPALKYYYMGFYIHSCPKMRYKGKLTASYLLCPETYTWILLTDEIREKLNENKYQRLNQDSLEKDANEFLENHLDSVLLLVDGRTCITYREYIQSFNIETLDNMLDMIRSRIYKEITGEYDDRESVLEYGRLVGKQCAHRMLYLNT